MKRIAISMLTLAITAAAGAALAAPQEYRNDSRNNNYNSSYDSRYDDRVASNRRNDVAQVIRVEVVNNDTGAYQRQECWNEQTRGYDDGYYRDDYGRLYRGDDRYSKTGVVVGAIVNPNNNNKSSSLANAIIGGLIANARDRDTNQYEYRDDTTNTVRRCRTVYDNENNSNYGDYDSYKVTYRYAGQTYTAFTDYRPGRTIRVRVSVRLQEDNLRFDNNR